MIKRFGTTVKSRCIIIIKEGGILSSQKATPGQQAGNLDSVVQCCALGHKQNCFFSETRAHWYDNRVSARRSTRWP